MSSCHAWLEPVLLQAYWLAEQPFCRCIRERQRELLLSLEIIRKYSFTTCSYWLLRIVVVLSVRTDTATALGCSADNQALPRLNVLLGNGCNRNIF